jgi:hypothetical protein
MGITADRIRIAGIVALVGAVITAALIRSSTGVLASSIGITAYENGTVLVQVPYRRDAPRGTVTIIFDETVVASGMPAAPRRYGNSNYVIPIRVPLPERVQVWIDFIGPGHSDSIEAWVIPTRSPALHRTADDIAEPIVIARALYALTKAHWADDKLPADPMTAATELSDDMRNGLVAGANLWSMKKGLPIHTAEVQKRGKETKIVMLEKALQAGHAATIFLGGHLVVLTGVVHLPHAVYLEVEDPQGLAGTTVYPYSDDMIRLAFTHTWQ